MLADFQQSLTFTYTVEHSCLTNKGYVYIVYLNLEETHYQSLDCYTCVFTESGLK